MLFAADGFATLTLNGIVMDPIADNVPRGKVSEGLADIDSVAVYVDDSIYEDAVSVTSGDDGGRSGFWCQHPYKGTFGPITVSIPLEEGTHIIRVETTPNAAGNTGFDEVAVTLEKREIPIDLEGQDPLPPPPSAEVKGLWHLDEAITPAPAGPPMQPLAPDADTTLLYHLDQFDEVPYSYWDWVWVYRDHWEWQWVWASNWEWVVHYDENGNEFWSWEEVWSWQYQYVQVWAWEYTYQEIWSFYATVPDSSWNCYTGRLYGSPALYQPGPVGMSLYFDGVDDYLEVQPPYNSPFDFGWNDFTIEAWVRPESVDGQRTILSRSQGGDGYLLSIVQGKLVLRLFVGSLIYVDFAGASDIPVGQWTYVAASRSADAITVYLNGVPDGGGTLPQWTSVCWTGAPVRVGVADSYAWGFFQGCIDEVRVSTVSRYLPPEPPVHLTPDASGNGNDGILRRNAAIVPGGHEGNALSGDCVEVPASPTLALGSADFTIEAWVHPFDTSGGPIICKVDGGNEYSLYLAGGLQPSFYLYGDGSGTSYADLLPTVSLPVGQWSHLAVQRAGDTIAMRVNGQEGSPGEPWGQVVRIQFLSRPWA